MLGMSGDIYFQNARHHLRAQGTKNQITGASFTSYNVLGTVVWKQLSASRVLVRMQLIVKQYFEGHILG